MYSPAIDSIAHKIVSQLDPLLGISTQLVRDLLLPCPFYTFEQSVANGAILNQLGISFTNPGPDFEHKLRQLGVTDDELDELLG